MSDLDRYIEQAAESVRRANLPRPRGGEQTPMNPETIKALERLQLEVMKLRDKTFNVIKR